MDMLEVMKEAIAGKVQSIRFTHRLKNHPVYLTSEGVISIEMEKVINAMPNDSKLKAQIVLEIKQKHPIAKIYSEDKEQLKDYTKILYAQARLI